MSGSAVMPSARLEKPKQLHGDHDEGDHFHEMSPDARGAMTAYIRKLDNVYLTTVGIDIGSSTSHLMFAKVHLRRKAQALSSQFVVVNREVLWRSPICLTPFVDNNTIDVHRLRAFFDEAYRLSGISPKDVDSGAVILTGEAIKRSNARSIASLFAADAGKFVCASAGHHLECSLAANGSGAVELSRRGGSTVLHVDIGGGTTKFAFIRAGEILGTCAIAVGGRLIAMDTDGRLTRVDESALKMAQAQGVELRLGEVPETDAVARLIRKLADAVVCIVQGRPLQGAAQQLALTEPLLVAGAPDAITFSGGVSEYLYRREEAVFGDIALPLTQHLLQAFADAYIQVPILDPGHGIRATVIGASQFSVQVSGRTIHVSDESALPLHNVPVLLLNLDAGEEISRAKVAAQVSDALIRAHWLEGDPVALAFTWQGDPHFARLNAVARGIADALDLEDRAFGALVLLIDGDVGETLGHILAHEVALRRNVISIDGLRLKSFDYVDIGEIIRPSNVIPVVIKSLLFSSGQNSN